MVTNQCYFQSVLSLPYNIWFSFVFQSTNLVCWCVWKVG